MFTCTMTFIFHLRNWPRLQALLSVSSNGNILVLVFIYSSKCFYFMSIGERLKHEFKNGILFQPVGSYSIWAVEGVCHCLLLQRQWKIAITGTVTVNRYYLLLETPGSVITSKKSQKSLIVMFLKQVFSPEFLYNQFTTSLHSIHVLKFYTITVLGWFWFSTELNLRLTIYQISTITESSVHLPTSKNIPFTSHSQPLI